MALYNPGPWGNATKHYQRPHVRVLDFPLEEGVVSPATIALIQYRINELIKKNEISDIDQYTMSIHADMLYVELLYHCVRNNEEQEKEVQFKLFSNEELDNCVLQVNDFLNEEAPFSTQVFGSFIPLKGKYLYGMFYTIDTQNV